MDYKVEETSPVTRKINVTVGTEEVNAALSATVALYRKRYEIKGFRHGKAPSSVVEAKYRSKIYSEATTDLVNYQINEILGTLKLEPLSRIDVDAKQLVRGEDFNYAIKFEIAPQFDLPLYEGLEVEVEKAAVKDEEVAAVEHRILVNAAKVKPIDEDRTAKDGDIVVVTFGAYKGDELFQGIQADNFELTLGEKQALPEFETLLKTLKAGEKGECEITFPKDFINPAMAGQTVTMRATLHAIKTRIMPELTDEVAKRAGGFESVAQMREAIRQSYLHGRDQLNKSVAEKKLLDMLISKMDFPLPPSLVANRMDRLLADLEHQMDRQGKSLESMGKPVEELREGMRPQAEEAVRGEIFLLAVAKKENLRIPSEAVDAELARIARQSRQDFMTVKQYYEENNLIFPLKDRLLADKAMDLIFDRAKRTEVPAKSVPGESVPGKSAPKKEGTAGEPAA